MPSGLKRSIDGLQLRFWRAVGAVLPLRHTPYGPSEKYIDNVRRTARYAVKLKTSYLIDSFPELDYLDRVDAYWCVNERNDLLLHMGSRRTIDFSPGSVPAAEIDGPPMPVEDVPTRGVAKPGETPGWLQTKS